MSKMSHATRGRRLLVLAGLLVALGVAAEASAEIDLDGESVEVVDPHLHPGSFGQQPASAKEFILNQVPAFVRHYQAAASDRSLAPFAEHVGIRDQTEAAGIDHTVLFAVYTHHTTGYYTNSELADALTDSRNETDDGEPWAMGLASINFDDFTDEGVAEKRLDALASYFEAYPERFVGIKLAHAHQKVALDNSDYYGVYEVAAEKGVPVLLHTGFSPFPGTKKERRYYDPIFAESVISKYDGTGEEPRVDFILSHAGQGDARSVEHALELTEKYPNVWLEISALDRPLLIDEEGDKIEDGSEEPQYKEVLAEIKRRDLVDRTIYASDGPQGTGKIKEYLNKIVDEMKAQDYTVEQMRAVLSENFWTLIGR